MNPQPAATLLTSNAELIAALRSTLVPEARVRLVVAPPPTGASPYPGVPAAPPAAAPHAAAAPVALAPPHDPRAGRPWSHRETEVVRLLADGLSTSVIARRMSYSERTIKGIVHALTERLQLRNRTHLVAFAIRHDLV